MRGIYQMLIYPDSYRYLGILNDVVVLPLYPMLLKIWPWWAINLLAIGFIGALAKRIAKSELIGWACWAVMLIPATQVMAETVFTAILLGIIYMIQTNRFKWIPVLFLALVATKIQGLIFLLGACLWIGRPMMLSAFVSLSFLLLYFSIAYGNHLHTNEAITFEKIINSGSMYFDYLIAMFYQYWYIAIGLLSVAAIKKGLLGLWITLNVIAVILCLTNMPNFIRYLTSVFVLTLLLCSPVRAENITKLNLDINRLIKAISIQEGNYRRNCKYPYGILKQSTNPRAECYKKIKREYHNWDGRGDFIDFLGPRYCPINGENDKNHKCKNWIPAVKKLYEKINTDPQYIAVTYRKR